MIELHSFPDGSTFELTEFTQGGRRVGHDMSTECDCLPWIVYINGEKRVTHVADEVST